MFGIGETELVIIVLFAFMLFGPDKLPGMGRTLGRVLRQFRQASDGFTEVVQTNIMDPASEELEKSPKQRAREAAEQAGETSGEALATETGSAQEEQAAPAPRRETFAERKARLAAERAAKQEQKQEVEAVADDADDGDKGDAGVVAPEPEPARTSAADLYAIAATQKSSRSQAAANKDDAADEPESGAGSEHVSEPEPESVAETQTDTAGEEG